MFRTIKETIELIEYYLKDEKNKEKIDKLERIKKELEKDLLEEKKRDEETMKRIRENLKAMK